AVLHAESVVVDAVGIFAREPLPGQRRINFPGVGLGGAVERRGSGGEDRVDVTRIPVVERAQIECPVRCESPLVTTVEIPFHAAAATVGPAHDGDSNSGIASVKGGVFLQPADIRSPSAEVETARMAVVETALHGGFAVGLGQSTKYVLAEEAYIARDGV